LFVDCRDIDILVLSGGYFIALHYLRKEVTYVTSPQLARSVTDRRCPPPALLTCCLHLFCRKLSSFDGVPTIIET